MIKLLFQNEQSQENYTSRILHLEIIVGSTDRLFSEIKIKIPFEGGSSNILSNAKNAEMA